MPIVYRVEDANGEGPYQGKWQWSWDAEDRPAFLRDLYDSEKLCPDPHPAPYEDGIEGRIDFDEFFGFRTLTALAAWMLREPHDGPSLAAKGFGVTVYEAFQEDIREGRRQCVFYRHRAVSVRRYTMDEVVALLPIPNEVPE